MQICSAQEYKIAIVGLVHSHVWGHLANILKSKDVKLVGVAEPNPALRAEAEKAGVDKSLLTDENYTQMLDRDQARHRLGIRRKQPPSGDREGLRAAQDQRDFREAAGFDRRGCARSEEARRPSTASASRPITRWPGGRRITSPRRRPRPNWDRCTACTASWDMAARDRTDARSQYFFAWLTDPVKNGAGALMDFGCYNALWSLWYLGKPETVYAHANHLRPETFPKVEDNADLILGYKNGVGIFEASWDLAALLPGSRSLRPEGQRLHGAEGCDPAKRPGEGRTRSTSRRSRRRSPSRSLTWPAASGRTSPSKA